MVKSVVEIDIERPRAQVATLFADPENSPKWMDDLERYEPIDGQFGMPGFRYRLVPKEGDMKFVATIVSMDLPNEVRVDLQGSPANVAIRANFIAISPTRTRLVSEERFTFSGIAGRVIGFLARGAIRKAHRRHIEAFKHFAERS